MFPKTSTLLIISLLFASTALALQNGDHYKCSHDKVDRPDPEFLDIEEEFPPSKERLLASTTTTYSNVRMMAYTGASALAASGYQSYFANDLLPPVLSYFQAALKVKYPSTSKISFSKTQTTICGVDMPASFITGVTTDFIYIVDVDSDTTTNFVANSYACYLSSGSKRPFVGKSLFNSVYFKLPGTDVLLHEQNIVCTMHELTHTLGFTSNLYSLFLDSNGVLLTGHIKSATLDGLTTTVLDIEPLTTLVKTHFGCSSAPGAYLENNGGSSTASSHFERRQYGFEAMTSPLIYQMQYSNFTLALLEGTGWWVPDYSYADPLFFGQGQGCNFLTQSCTASGFSFDDFCTGSSQGCTNPGRGGGSCTADSMSDSCTYIHPNINYDCENSNAASYARLPTLQTFGRGLGSKCFTGNISSTSDSATTTSFCFKYSCSGSGSSTVLTVMLGSASLKCAKEGTAKVTVNGHAGVINCPDPLTFCSTIGNPICPRNCMGRGTCVKGVCTCNSGFTGTDCGLNA